MLIASLLLMSKIAVGNLSERPIKPCLPNGCYYDLENGLTKRIQCMKDGSQEIIYFSGHNGCEFDENLIPELFYKSSIDNPCCIPDSKKKKKDSQVYPACVDNLDCIRVQANEYCQNGQCVFNGCYDQHHPLQNDCLLNNPVNTRSGEGCICSPLSIMNVNNGICVPQSVNDEDQDPLLSSKKKYSITVENMSGKDQTIAIFEINPSLPGDGSQTTGYPVVFAAQAAADGESTSIHWSLDWGLSWSAGPKGSCQALTSDIIYSPAGAIVPASPQKIGDNGAFVTFNNDVAIFKISPQNYPNAPDGGIYLETDDSFTNADALNNCFSICVMQGTTPVFAIEGEPSFIYYFPLSPTYYLTIIDQKQGDIVSATVISQATPITFADGVNNIKLCLNPYNKFVSCPQIN